MRPRLVLAGLLLLAGFATPATAAPLAEANLTYTRAGSNLTLCGSGSVTGSLVAGYWTLTAVGASTAEPVIAALVGPYPTRVVPPGTCVTLNTSGTGEATVTLAFIGGSTGGDVLGICVHEWIWEESDPTHVAVCGNPSVRGTT